MGRRKPPNPPAPNGGGADPPPGADGPPVVPGPFAPPPLVEREDFLAGCGEDLRAALDVDTWDDALSLTAAIERLEKEIAEGVEQQADHEEQIRRLILPRIASLRFAPGAGIYRVNVKQLERVQANTLLNGGVEAADGTVVMHDTLPVTVTQIGVCLVSYLGGQGAWGHRLFRRDMRIRGENPTQEMWELLRRRQLRSNPEYRSRRDTLSELIRRGAMAYAERAVLARRSDADWRLGHGQPVPYELLTGSGSMDLLRMGLDLMRELVLDHRKFIFVPSRADRLWEDLGSALPPMRFAIIDTTEEHARRIVDGGNLRGEHRAIAERFVNEVSPNIVVGVYRVHPHGPAQVFYAHPDYAQDAAMIAMADSVLQPHRSFPTLLDLAHSVVNQLFGPETFEAAVQNAYTRSGHPLRYLNERQTRSG